MSEMSPFDRAAEILDQVLQVPSVERGARAMELAGDNPEVQELLKTMLRGLESSASGLESPLVNFFDGGPGAMPETVGPYRLEKWLGQGGMGVVYQARQSSPERKVALKLLMGGTLNPSALRRFEHETAVLGHLNHPGIAQVFEGGVARVGAAEQPFIAMELVEGLPIDQFAESHGLSLKRRLELWVELCDAVQHAHQN
ncbi:MAG: protein kinase, partial [Planctomycetota bacterium]|nr:protein kinase [Planctomycetota bacterium]